MEEKSHKKRWSTLRESETGITVSGRVVVEQPIVQVNTYTVSPQGKIDDNDVFVVQARIEIGRADEGAIVKAFTALGRRFAQDALRERDDLAA